MLALWLSIVLVVVFSWNEGQPSSLLEYSRLWEVHNAFLVLEKSVIHLIIGSECIERN